MTADELIAAFHALAPADRARVLAAITKRHPKRRQRGRPCCAVTALVKARVWFTFRGYILRDEFSTLEARPVGFHPS